MRLSRDGSPFRAVSILIAFTSQNWRTVRARLVLGGLGDPLRAIGSLPALLDVVEHLVTEAKANQGGDALQHLYFELYRPDAEEVKRRIAEEDTDTDFDAFAALGMK